MTNQAVAAVQTIAGTVRIGTGKVRHPATKTGKSIVMQCGCHSNNLIRSRIAFFSGLVADCKR